MMSRKLFSLICFALSVSSFYIVGKLIRLDVSLYTKWFAVSAVFAFFSGVQLLSIGFLGEYLGRVHHQIQERPDYIIEKVH